MDSMLVRYGIEVLRIDALRSATCACTCSSWISSAVAA